MASQTPPQTPDPGVWGPFARRPWAPFLLPMAVYMIGATFLPGPPDTATGAEADNWFGLRFNQYPLVYAAVIAATAATVVACRRPVLAQFPLRVSPLAVLVGVVGVVLWVGICGMGIEDRLVAALGENSDPVALLGLSPRQAFNPFEQLDSRAAVWGFLAVRLFGLALVAPVIEELMLRGWLMRHLATDGYRPEFWMVPFGVVTTASVIVGTAFPMLYHPEKLAALVWFSLVTWLMVRTKNFWDCVAAHAVTNFLLGVWVVWRGAWELW